MKNRFQRSQQRQAAAKRAAKPVRQVAPALRGEALARVKAELAAASKAAKIGPHEQRRLLTETAKRLAAKGGILAEPVQALKMLLEVLSSRESNRSLRKDKKAHRLPASDLLRWQEAEARRKGGLLIRRQKSAPMTQAEAKDAFADMGDIQTKVVKEINRAPDAPVPAGDPSPAPQPAAPEPA